MSRRSFFRYFSSKEELVAREYDAWRGQLTATLAARPPDEEPWTALRRTFDDIVDFYADPQRRGQIVALQNIVAETPPRVRPCWPSRPRHRSTSRASWCSGRPTGEMLSTT